MYAAPTTYCTLSMGNTGKAIAVVCFISLCCIAQQNHRRFLIAPYRPISITPGPPTTNGPTMWLDVSSLTNLSDGQPFTSWTDRTINAYVWIEDTTTLANITNSFRFHTNFGGVVAPSNTANYGMRYPGLSSNMFGRSNPPVQVSAAMRVYMRNLADGSGQLFLGGSNSPADYLYLFWWNNGIPGEMYADFGNSSPTRINSGVALPLSNWVNLIFTRRSTNWTQVWSNGILWFQGTNNAVNFSAPIMYNASLFGDVKSNRVFVKRFLTWSNALSDSEVSDLNNWMTTNQP